MEQGTPKQGQQNQTVQVSAKDAIDKIHVEVMDRIFALKSISMQILQENENLKAQIQGGVTNNAGLVEFDANKK
jgi:hypothetical protein